MKPMRRFLSQFVFFVLSLQLAVGPAILEQTRWSVAYADEKNPSLGSDASGSANADPVVAEMLRKFELLADELENASPDVPAPRSSDQFHLVGQTVVTTKKTIPLEGVQIEPEYFGLDFDSEVSVEFDSSGLALVGKRKNVEIVRQTIPGLEVRSVARIKEILAVLLKDGRLLAMDLGFAKKHAFRSPLPLIEVAQVRSDFVHADTKIAFGTRGLKPPSSIAEGAVLPESYQAKGEWDAGDLLVFNTASGARELVGDYQHGTLRMFLASGMAAVFQLAVSMAPSGRRQELEKLTALLEDPVFRAEAVAARENLPMELSSSLLAINDSARDTLLSRISACRVHAGSPRDCYLTEEWAKDYAKIEALARQELEDLKQSNKREAVERRRLLEQRLQQSDLSLEWQNAIRSEVYGPSKKKSIFGEILSDPDLRLLAGVTAAGAAMVAGTLFVSESGHAPEWAVYAVNRLQELGIIPSVLKDAAYRSTLFKGSAALLSLISVPYIIGYIYGKPKKIGAREGSATLGIRVFAQLQKPIISRLMWLLRQTSALPAMRLGLNPFAQVQPESAIGQRVGLKESTRLAVGIGRGQEEQKAALTQAAENQNRRVMAYSSVLARAVVAEKAGLDPATLLLAEQGKLQVSDLERVETDPVLQKEWRQVARELHTVMLELKSNRVLEDVRQIPLQELAQDYAVAKKVAGQINARKGSKTLEAKARLRMIWQNMGPEMMRFASSVGHEQYVYLDQERPQAMVYESSTSQFNIDFYLAIVQMGGYGARADFNHPEALAANAHSFLWTTPAHLSDMGEQVAIYGISVPARYVQMYQKDAEVVETLFAPIEDITLESVARPDSFATGLWRWTKGALNLRKADYGSVFMRGIKRRLSSIQAAIIMGLATRVALAGQALPFAISAFFLTLASGDWAYAWPWQPINIGNHLYTAEIDEYNAAFKEAKSAVSRGIRLNNAEILASGYEKLERVFEQHYNAQIPQEMRNHIQAAENLLALPPEDRVAALKDLKLAYGPVARLSRALDSGDRSEIRAAHQALKAQVHGVVPSDDLEKLNARSLLEYSLQNPPFRNEANKNMKAAMTMVGALSTTFLASFLSRDSFDPAHLTLANLAQVALHSAAMYFGFYWAQKKVINPLAERIKMIRERQRVVREIESGQFEQERQQILASQPKTLDEFVDQYVKSQAEAFQVSEAVVRGRMTAEVRTQLARQYQAYTAKLAAIESEKGDCAGLLTVPQLKPYTFWQKVKLLITGK